jgi:formylglycine-generating enzyme
MSTRRLSSALLSLLLAASVSPAQDVQKLDLGEEVRLEVVRVKKGTFRQGSPADEAGRNADETSRDVTLTRDFDLGKYPVTRRQFARFVAETGYRTEAESGPSGGYGFDGKQLVQRRTFNWRDPGFPQSDDHPVTIVTYDDAKAFCAWLAQKTGRAWDLPTEAQWEYACRAGTTTPYWNGRTAKEALEAGWYSKNAGKATQSVGKKKANPFGLYDMGGNVWQWCRDWYGPYRRGPVIDPERSQPDESDPPRRVLRGGSWLKDVRNGRSAARFRSTPGTRNADVGFRVLMTVRDGAAARPPAAVLASVTVPARWAGGPVTAQAPDRTPEFTAVRWLTLLCGAVVCLGTVGVAILILTVLIRRTGPSVVEAARGIRTPVSRYPIRSAADGFWVSELHCESGSVVCYRCRVAGQTRRGEFTVVRPGADQFVYTGGEPSDVEILEIVPPGGVAEDVISGPDVGIAPGPPVQSDFVEDSAPAPFGGFPSAY